MDSEDRRNIGLLGFDERTETWFIEIRDAHRIALSRESLGSLVALYNSIHTGKRLVLSDERSIQRLEGSNRKLAEAVRDLHLEFERRQQRSVHYRVARFLTSILQRIPRRSAS